MSFSAVDKAPKEPEVPNLFAVKNFQQKHINFLTMGGLRFQIFNADKNGLAASGAIIRVGGKVLIDEAKYFSWIEAGAK